MTYDEWIQYVFDRPVTDGGERWYFQEDETGADLNWWKPTPTLIAEYLARLCEHAYPLVRLFSGEQIDQGLTFIFGIGSSRDYDTEQPIAQNYCERALHDSVPRALQVRWIRTVFLLYRDLFARVCTDSFGLYRDGSDRTEHPLNDTCFMLWDWDDLYRHATSRARRHLVDPVFSVLEQTLRLDHAACQAGALHALGHLHEDFTTRVEAAIDAFVTQRKKIQPNVLRYAEDARRGSVL